MRIIFMGTPDFAVPSLQALVEQGYEVVAVITATDKIGGRNNKQLIESDVKKYAQQKGLNILQPKNLKAPEFVEKLRSLKADLQIVVAFRMLPEVVWNMPPMGTLNLHGSLLPRYRGAAPINWAIINGEKETGVSTFLLKHEIDTGNVLLQEKLPIGTDENVGEIYNKLKELGAQLLIRTVEGLEKDSLKAHEQDESLVCHAPKIFHENCRMNLEHSLDQLHNFVRGLSPYPTAWAMLGEDKIKIFRTSKENASHKLTMGTLLSDGKKYLKVAVKGGYLHLLDIQMSKRKRMDIRSFLNGYTISDTENQLS